MLTAPGLVRDALACVGETLEDRLELLPLETTYRAQYADGSTIDVHADPAAFASEAEAVCGPGAGAEVTRYLAHLRELDALQWDVFIDRNLDTPLDLLGPALLRLVRMGGFGKLAPHVDRFFTDERLRRLFSFQALYAGVSPFTAIAAYAVIAELDIGKGVWHPVGGIHAVPAALAAAAADAGVVFRYDTAVASLDLRGGRAHGVRLADGELLPADAVVVTADQAELLVPLRRRRRPTTPPAAWPSTSACATRWPARPTTPSPSGRPGSRCSRS